MALELSTAVSSMAVKMTFCTFLIDKYWHNYLFRKALAIRMADCAAITRWRLFSRFVTPVLTCATTE